MHLSLVNRKSPCKTLFFVRLEDTTAALVLVLYLSQSIMATIRVSIGAPIGWGLATSFINLAAEPLSGLYLYKYYKHSLYLQYP